MATRSWERTHYSREITPEMDGEEVIVTGWVRAFIDKGKLKFIKLVDREGFVQITAKVGEVSPHVMEKIQTLGREDVVAVKGTVKENIEAPERIELIPIDIKIINIAEKPLPLEMETKKTPALLPVRLDQRPLDLRKPENQAILTRALKCQPQNRQTNERRSPERGGDVEPRLKFAFKSLYFLKFNIFIQGFPSM